MSTCLGFWGPSGFWQAKATLLRSPLSLPSRLQSAELYSSFKNAFRPPCWLFSPSLSFSSCYYPSNRRSRRYSRSQYLLLLDRLLYYSGVLLLRKHYRHYQHLLFSYPWWISTRDTILVSPSFLLPHVSDELIKMLICRDTVRLS